MKQFVVTQPQIQAAMSHFERLAPPRDGISICKEVSKLADLLGVMWFAKEEAALVSEGSSVHELLIGAGVILDPAPAESAPAQEDAAPAESSSPSP